MTKDELKKELDNTAEILQGHMVMWINSLHDLGDAWDSIPVERKDELKDNWQRWFRSDLRQLEIKFSALIDELEEKNG